MKAIKRASAKGPSIISDAWIEKCAGELFYAQTAKKFHLISVRCNEKQYQEVIAATEKLGVSVSDIVRLALSSYMDNVDELARRIT